MFCSVYSMYYVEKIITWDMSVVAELGEGVQKPKYKQPNWRLLEQDKMAFTADSAGRVTAIYSVIVSMPCH